MSFFFKKSYARTIGIFFENLMPKNFEIFFRRSYAEKFGIFFPNSNAMIFEKKILESLCGITYAAQVKPGISKYFIRNFIPIFSDYLTRNLMRYKLCQKFWNIFSEIKCQNYHLDFVPIF